MSDLSLNDHDMDLRMQAQRLMDIANEVSDHVHGGNLPGAALALGLAHYKINAYAESVSAFLDRLRGEGVTPDDALKDR